MYFKSETPLLLKNDKGNFTQLEIKISDELFYVLTAVCKHLQFIFIQRIDHIQKYILKSCGIDRYVTAVFHSSAETPRGIRNEQDIKWKETYQLAFYQLQLKLFNIFFLGTDLYITSKGVFKDVLNRNDGEAGTERYKVVKVVIVYDPFMIKFDRQRNGIVIF